MQLFCKARPSMAPGKDGLRKWVMLLEGRLGCRLVYSPFLHVFVLLSRALP